MKLITFCVGNDEAHRLGALDSAGNAVDLAAVALTREPVALPMLASMQALIEAGEPGLEAAASMLDAAGAEHIHEAGRFSYRAPLPRPVQMRDFANYEGHVLRAMEASMRTRARAEPDLNAAMERFRASGQYTIAPVWYEQPIYFKCNRMTVIGHEQDVIWPHYAKLMDYEIELACVIGKGGRDIARADARDHIFGYTIFNDFSARDALAREMGFRMGPCKGKDFDTGNILGPCIVTRDELPDPYALEMIVRINGTEVTRSSSAGPQHDFERCIEHVSMSETLYPGEVMALGTIDNGCGFESESYLSDGDVVELEVQGIGILRNRLVRGGN